LDWWAIGEGIMARPPLLELRAAYRRTDIIALDLDHCVFPGYSQTVLGRRIAWRLLRRPQRGRDRRFLPKLALGAFFFSIKEAKLFLGLATPMRRLVARYERVMRGIPEHYFTEAAEGIPGDSYPLAAETVAELAARARTGIITLGLDVVARAYVGAFRTADAPSLSFFDANTVAFRREGGLGRVFERYDPEALMLSGEHKRRALERRMADFDAQVPTTIGHSEDDAPLARLARQRGGLAIGFNPPPRLRGAFDVVVAGQDWERMYALVAILDGQANVGA